jgi:signal transduction histidine kinase
MDRALSSEIRKFGLALLAVMAALLVRWSLNPILGEDRFSLTPFLAAIVFCAWYCGVRASIFAAALSVLAEWYFFFEPRFTFRLAHPDLQLGGVSVFAVLSSLVIALGEANRRARANLEDRVRHRTAQLSAANANLSSLTARLLQLQDEERRRFARELHDSVGQLIAAIAMNMSTLQKSQLSPKAGTIVQDNIHLAQEASRQIRTISHLLHPPLLDELGLSAAIRWCVDGFSRRSGIEMDFKAPDVIDRFEPDVELAALRVVQECLTNIHRHSGSKTGRVEVQATSTVLQVTVRDFGRGIPPAKSNGAVPVGVGLRGMAERLAQLGGGLEIHSDGTGTEVRAMLPAARVQASANIEPSRGSSGVAAVRSRDLRSIS